MNRHSPGTGSTWHTGGKKQMGMSQQKMCRGPLCDRPGTRRGPCAAHYLQLRRGIELKPVIRKTVAQYCTFPECTLLVESGTVCKPHSLQMHRDRALKPLRKNSVGSVSDACEVIAITGHAPQGLLCKCTACDREYRKRLHIKTRYRLSWEEYTSLFRFQADCCAICKSLDPRGKDVWHVDHDHECCPESSQSCGGCVRGILCSPCNSYGVAWYESLPVEMRTFDLLNNYIKNPPARRWRMLIMDSQTDR
ncbi:hypothetical protein E6R61_30850 [Streptomyces sp. LRa12]|nr:hypothetical protein E6R61_30850 [Streptomyces sp. LRa12]